MSYIDTQIRHTEECFQQIFEQRMQGMPIVNEALEVKAVGFREWKGRTVGILITPWFMNLMLLTADGESWDGLQLGEQKSIEFPSRNYPFSVNEFDGIGRCLTHSLCSPMFQFESQAEAVAYAESVMAGLEQEADEVLKGEEAELERYMRKEGMFDGEQVEKKTDMESGRPITDKLEQPMNRREMLFGAFRSKNEDSK